MSLMTSDFFELLLDNISFPDQSPDLGENLSAFFFFHESKNYVSTLLANRVMHLFLNDTWVMCSCL